MTYLVIMQRRDNIEYAKAFSSAEFTIHVANLLARKMGYKEKTPAFDMLPEALDQFVSFTSLVRGGTITIMKESEWKYD
jgi:hypothetical protein